MLVATTIHAALTGVAAAWTPLTEQQYEVLPHSDYAYNWTPSALEAVSGPVCIYTDYHAPGRAPSTRACHIAYI